jgi:hypothetical protein
LKFDPATGEGEVLCIGEFSPFHICESVLRFYYLEFIGFYGNIQCAVEHVVKIQAQFLEIWFLLLDTSIFGIGFRWTRCDAVPFFELASEGDPFTFGQGVLFRV